MREAEQAMPTAQEPHVPPSGPTSAATHPNDATRAQPDELNPPPRWRWPWWRRDPAPSEQQDHFTLDQETAQYANRILLYNAIAEQIWREQQLVSTRMQWNFTFQAFLAGIYVFTGSNLDELPRTAIQIVLCLAGFFVTLFCLFGVIAAQNQSTRHKEHWAHEFHPKRPGKVGNCDLKQGAYPQPFSSSKGSGWGRYASRGVCGALMVMWLAMGGITGWLKDYSPAKTSSGAYSCELKPARNGSGNLDISCRIDGLPATAPAPIKNVNHRTKSNASAQ